MTSDVSIPSLSGFTGSITTPDHPDYDSVRNSKGHLGSPAAVLAPRTAKEVADAISAARDGRLPLSVRSGGHSAAGHSTNEGGIVIDLSSWNTVEVTDRNAGLVTVGTGALWGDVATALADHGLAISSGDTRSVGVGGLTLGGGIGWTVRRDGLTIDNLRAATIVTADGRELRVSADEHPDLFWAIRGGVGNVGIATSFEFVARQMRHIHTAEVHYPTENLAELIQGWVDATADAPREITATAFMVPAGFGPFGGRFMVHAVYADDDESAAAAALAPLTTLGTPISSEIKRIRYADVLEDPPPAPPGAGPEVRNRFISTWTDGVAATIAEHLSGAAAALQLRTVGGAVNDVPADATAFAHRDAESLIITAAFSPEAGTATDALWTELAPSTSGAYSAFLSDPTGDDLRAAFPKATFDRLAAIKQEYDPENLFSRTPSVATP